MENERDKALSDSGLLFLTNILDNMWKGLKKFFWLLPLLIVLGGGGMFFRTWHFYTPTYQAYSSFVISVPDGSSYIGNYYNKTTAEQINTTFPYILESGMLSAIVAEDLGVSSIPGTISTDVVENTSIFTIYVTSTDAQMAYDILQSIIENYPSVAYYIIGETVFTLLDESGVPTTPLYAPAYERNITYGVAGGIALFIALLVLYALMRRTVRREEDLKNRLSLECLGKVPMIHQKKRSRQQRPILMDQKEYTNVLGESYRTIRTRILKNEEKEQIKSILVTSTSAGEGKSTVSANLAISLAKRGARVVLIDADLRHPSVAKTLGIATPAVGLCEVLNGEVKLSEAMYVYNDKMKVLTGSKSISDPTQLLGGQRMRAVLRALSEAADYVIVDSPPCGGLSDATLLARRVDACVMVVRQDYTQIDRIVAGVESIAETRTPLLGYVLNCAEAGITGYGYSYGYGYGYGRYGYGRYGYGRYGYGRYGYGRYGYGYGYGYGEKSHSSRRKKEESKEQE